MVFFSQNNLNEFMARECTDLQIRPIETIASGSFF